MAETLILLTGEVEALHFTEFLHQLKPELKILHASSKLELETICNELSEDDLTQTRLVAFCINVIVPKGVLAKMPGPSYNFHPGPPEYPGSHSAHFAFHDKKVSYGVTFHEMTEEVDEGQIISTQNFGIASCDSVAEIETRAYANLIELFKNLAPEIADVTTPIAPQITLDWCGPKRGEAEAAALK